MTTSPEFYNKVKELCKQYKIQIFTAKELGQAAAIRRSKEEGK